MTQRAAQIPKFGSWDANDHTAYTVVFDHARAGKGGAKVVNSDGNENNVNQGISSTTPAPQQQRKTSNDEVLSNIRHRRHASRGEELLKPPPHHSRRASRDDSDVGSNPRHGRRHSRGEELSYAHLENRSLGGSPMHPGRGGRIGSASPAIDKKLEGGPGTPSRNRPEKQVTTLPKFGDWDLSNPAAAEGFTVIFNKARDEKKTGGVLRIPDSPLKPEADAQKGQPVNQKSNSASWLCGCFNPSTKQ